MRLFCFLLLLLTTLAAPAQDDATLTAAQTRAEQLRLHEDAQWRRLLHFAPGERRSEIISPDFFLAGAGSSPRAELQAAIVAWFATPAAEAEGDPRCRFPARFRWLREKLQLDTPEADFPNCHAFAAWSHSEALRSVSLIMVSGYLGNPASSFGHALLKLNRGEPVAGNDLLDLSFNFGADVPAHEPVPLYMFYGLFGGYEANFSSGPFYQHDQVYVRTEFRDLWEYELRLDSAQRQRVVEHLWELRGARFRYYFLSENCAYRLGQLLNVGLERDLVPKVHVWFTPVELFHRLADARQGDQPLVAQLRFLPSNQRRLYAQFAQLQPAQARVTNALIADDLADLPQQLQAFAPAQRSEIVDTLLAYHEYRLAAQFEEQSDPHLLQDKDRLLRLRLTMPTLARPPPKPVTPAPPSRDARPMLAGLGWTQTPQGAQATLRYAPYFQDLIGRHATEGLELKVLDGSAHSDGEHLRLDQLDMVAIRRLSDAPDIHGESRLSWQARAGLRRPLPLLELPEHNPLLPQLEAGAGRSLRCTSLALCYALLDVQSAPGYTPLQTGSSLGLLGGREPWRLQLDWTGRYDLRRERWRSQYEAALRLSLAAQLELRGLWQHAAGENNLSLNLFRYW